MIEASRIGPKLWQGSRPPLGRELERHGVGVVVLCALELQYEEGAFARTRVVPAPMDDADADEWTVRVARGAARTVIEHLYRGRRVLVTCAQGRNRSGLVVALAVRAIARVTGAEALRRVQAYRENALTNPQFAAYLESLNVPRPR